MTMGTLWRIAAISISRRSRFIARSETKGLPLPR